MAAVEQSPENKDLQPILRIVVWVSVVVVVMLGIFYVLINVMTAAMDKREEAKARQKVPVQYQDDAVVKKQMAGHIPRGDREDAGVNVPFIGDKRIIVKNIVLIGSKQFLIDKMIAFLAKQGYRVFAYRSDDISVEQILKTDPHLVFIQYSDDEELAFAADLRKSLKATPSTNQVPLVLFCTESIWVEASQKLGKVPIISYFESSDLLKKTQAIVNQFGKDTVS